MTSVICLLLVHQQSNEKIKTTTQSLFNKCKSYHQDTKNRRVSENLAPLIQIFVPSCLGSKLLNNLSQIFVTAHPVISRCAVRTEKSRSNTARFLASLEMTRWLSRYKFSLIAFIRMNS